MLKDDDFKRVDIEATPTVDIIDFVQRSEVNPMYFQKPYYLVPEKGGVPAYRLVHDVLAGRRRRGMAKVVIRTRQHLAAVKAQEAGLVLEIRPFADELVDVAELNLPEARQKPRGRELEMAKTLVEQMTETWDPTRYTDDYTAALMAMIKDKIAHGGRAPAAPAKPRKGTNVIDLTAVLRESLEKAGGAPRRRGRRTPMLRRAKASRAAQPDRARRRAKERIARTGARSVGLERAVTGYPGDGHRGNPCS